MKAMRKRQEAERKATMKKHEAAMQEIKAAMLALELEQAEELNEMVGREKEEISAAMQAFETKLAACRFYHEAPDDVFEMIVLQFPDLSEEDGHLVGKGGLNVLRLVSKRCLRVVESVATRLTHMDYAGANSLPAALLDRCKRIEHIRCDSLCSLEGCPVGLKSLVIRYGDSMTTLQPLSVCKDLDILEIVYAPDISDLSPLSSCTRLKKLILPYSSVADLSPLLSMPLLEELHLIREFTFPPSRTSIFFYSARS